MTADIVVVGGGLAGCWAAATAAGAGARVTLVRRTMGATAVSSGAIDFVPPTEASDPAAWLRRLERADTVHPYTAGRTPRLDELEAEGRRLAAALGEAGLAVRAALRDPVNVAALTGQVRHAGVTLETIAAGDLRPHGGGTIAVAGIAGLARINARAVAAAVESATAACGAPVRALAVEVVLEVPADDLDDATLARAVDAPGGARALGAALRSTLDAGGAAATGLVLLPAVLGLDRAGSVAAEVAEAAGVPVAELLTPPPSAPGWRLDAACRSLAAAAGVDTRVGQVIAIHGAPRVERVELRGGERLPCGAVVLASGKFIGGGLTLDRRVREPLLDLPVTVRGIPAERLAPGDLVDRVRFGAQPFLEAGVRTDGQGRPLGPSGHPVRDNLHACGALCAGVDTALSGGGLGVAAWSAARAARAAAGAPASV